MAETELEDLGTLVGGFYDPAKKASAVPEVGQIAYCPVIEQDRRLRIAEVRRVDSYAHTEVVLHIREQKDSDFRGKDARTPIKGLGLDRTQEIIIAKGKMRPCVVLAKCDGVDPATIQHEPQRKLATSLHPAYLLAPIFSVSTVDDLGVFGPIMSARVRCCMYPEFFYLPRSGGILKVPGVARLDRMFLQAPHPGLGFEGTELFLIPQIFAVLRAQLAEIFTGSTEEELKDIRGLMAGCLPDHCKSDLNKSK